MSVRKITTDQKSPYLTIKEIAEHYRVSPTSIYRGVEKGSFPKPVKVGNQNRWHRDSLPKHDTTEAD